MTHSAYQNSLAYRLTRSWRRRRTRFCSKSPTSGLDGSFQYFISQLHANPSIRLHTITHICLVFRADNNSTAADVYSSHVYELKAFSPFVRDKTYLSCTILFGLFKFVSHASFCWAEQLSPFHESQKKQILCNPEKNEAQLDTATSSILGSRLFKARGCDFRFKSEPIYSFHMVDYSTTAISSRTDITLLRGLTRHTSTDAAYTDRRSGRVQAHSHYGVREGRSGGCEP